MFCYTPWALFTVKTNDLDKRMGVIMNKDDVSRHLAKQLLDKKQAKASVDKVFEIIKHGLQRDGKVVISNFGSFNLKTARPVTRRNPKTGAKVEVPAKQKVRFKPSENLLSK